MTRPQLLVSRAAVQLLRDGGSHGLFTTRTSRPEDVAAVVAVRDTHQVTRPCRLDPRHFLATAPEAVNGRWYRAEPELHGIWWNLAIRQDTCVARETFANLVRGPVPATTAPYWTITYLPDGGPVELLGWSLDAGGATPIDLEIEPPEYGVASLAPAWPAKLVQQAHVLLVGAGSVGSAAAHALADAGIGTLTIVDPDRLRWHNLVRHHCRPRHVGRYKVNALRDDLRESRPDTHINAYPVDAVQDADLIRPLVQVSDLVLCTADGVAVRRVLGHLARRASRTAVLACVLDDGAIGEVLRLRPWPDHGCLNCRRTHLIELGGVDPEPGLDAGYGTGTIHRPMTAVGADLDLVGSLAARVAVCTLLERRGQPGQRLPGEHAIVSLRPPGDLAPPFDAQDCLQLSWQPAVAPEPDCPTCHR